MEKKFCSVYEISFYTGIILTVLIGCFTILNYYFFRVDNFKDYFDNFNVKELFVLFGYIITQLGIYVGILFTNRDNTPCHIFIIWVFGQLAFYMDIFLLYPHLLLFAFYLYYLCH